MGWFDDVLEQGGVTGQAGAARVLDYAPQPDGSYAPAPVQPMQPGAYQNQLLGFNQDKLNAGKIDPKYRFGAIASQYDVNDPSQRGALLTALQNDPSGFFKGASWDKEALNLGGGNEFNVVGANGWHWDPSGTANSQMGAAAGGGPQSVAGPMMNGMAGGGMAGGWTGALAPQPTAYTPQSIDVPGAYQATPFEAPAAFQAPTAEEAAADPGYQFTQQQGNKALLASRAAQHVLRGGATAEALADYNQGLASTQYQNVYNRKLGEQQNAYTQALGTNQLNNQTGANAYGLTNQYRQSAQGQNAANALTANQQNYQNALQAWQGNVNAQLGQGNLNLGYTQAANSYALGQGNLGLGWANFGLGQQAQNFNQGFSLADLGFRAAQASGNYGGQYGANAGNLLTGQGNANAAAGLYGGQAWANALGGIGTAAGGALGSYYGNQGYGPAGRPPTPYGYG